MKLFIYPQLKEKQVLNPYVNNMERAMESQFEIIRSEYRYHLPQSIRLLLGSVKADVYVFNWIEGAADGVPLSFLHGIITFIALKFIILRNAKIVWILHNIHPHNGETKWSKRIKKLLFTRSALIVSHSKEAEDYAKQYAKCSVCFKSHPIVETKYEEWGGELHECDYYLWGNILPYKGVVEFISNPCCVTSQRKVLVVGKCSDNEIINEIEHCCNDNIVFENRRADFNEVAAQCRKAKYVLFPYVGESVSSSGALMDTLMMGGTPVGPNRGAFADLAKLGCCITYDSINEVFELPIDNEKVIKLEKSSVQEFLTKNTWAAFAEWLANIINKPQ